MFLRLIPFVFVLLWASGFVGAKLGLEYAEPATLLSIRVVGNLIVFALLMLLLKHKLPKGASFWHSWIAGVFLQGLFLGGAYTSIAFGLPAAMCSLLLGMQPILTAIILMVVAYERFDLFRWLGLILGFIGVALVLEGGLDWQTGVDSAVAIGLSVVALFGITIGTLYQKRFCREVDLVGGILVQNFAAAAIFIPFAFLFESMHIHWTVEFAFTIGWLVIVVSCIATLLLMFMVDSGETSKVASVFYLVPPVTALQAWLFFDESFDTLGVGGFLLTAVAVYLVMKSKRPRVITEKSRGQNTQFMTKS